MTEETEGLVLLNLLLYIVFCGVISMITKEKHHPFYNYLICWMSGVSSMGCVIHSIHNKSKKYNIGYKLISLGHLLNTIILIIYIVVTY